jgi:hypothetical protein
MPEEAKRLAPTSDTLRELFLKSGNLCAFPGCGKLMMNAEGTFVGQLCHIEAAEKGGERFNAAMSNEERRAASNLMLMCYEHHSVTNDVVKYPVEVMRRLKRDHELRFSHPDRAMLEQLRDWTTAEEPIVVCNLKRMNEVLNWRQGEEELLQSMNELNRHIEKLALVPIEVRRFLGAVAMRINRVWDTGAVSSGLGGTKILISDLKGALRLSERALFERANELDAYGLGCVDEIFEVRTDIARPAIRLAELKSGWCVWLDLAKFCVQASEPIDAFAADLDFGRLDG